MRYLSRGQYQLRSTAFNKLWRSEIFTQEIKYCIPVSKYSFEIWRLSFFFPSCKMEVQIIYLLLAWKYCSFNLMRNVDEVCVQHLLQFKGYWGNMPRWFITQLVSFLVAIKQPVFHLTVSFGWSAESIILRYYIERKLSYPFLYLVIEICALF